MFIRDYAIAVMYVNDTLIWARDESDIYKLDYFLWKQGSYLEEEVEDVPEIAEGSNDELEEEQYEY